MKAAPEPNFEGLSAKDRFAMQDERKSQPCGILKPTLKVIDRLRHALDRAIEEKNEKAVALLSASIEELAASVHEIQGDATGTADKG